MLIGSDIDERLSRRSVLAGALTGGVAAVLPSAGGASADASPAPKLPNATEFFSDQSLNFQALFALGAVSYNAAQPGEVLETFNRVHARGDTYRAYFEEFLALGRRLRRLGDEAADRGRRVTARDSYLRAASYLDQALYYVLASNTPTRAHEGAVYREMESCWAAAAARFRPGFQPVSIPYERRRLPGWLLTPGGSRVRRPTLILNNGSDAQNVDMYIAGGGAAALERGWNALIFEGPGQGSNLFAHNIPFRPDWERVITPIVSWLRDRPEVDERRITLFGSSFGGYLVPRAAAFERRLAGLAVDPGATNAFISWRHKLPAQLITLLNQGKRQEFNREWAAILPHLPATVQFDIAKRSEIYGNGSFYDKMRLAERFVLSPAVVGRIRAPMILAEAEQEQFFPGQSKQMYDWLRARRALARFTVAEGAQFHCEPMAPTLRNDTLLGWLEANLKPTS